MKKGRRLFLDKGRELQPRCVMNARKCRSQPKILGGAKYLTLSKQRYFIRDTASGSTKRQGMLEILEVA